MNFILTLVRLQSIKCYGIKHNLVFVYHNHIACISYFGKKLTYKQLISITEIILIHYFMNKMNLIS